MKGKSLLLFLIIITACLLPFGTDIYAPSIPAVAASLGVGAHLVQISLAIYLFGVCATQLIYGALSEVYGRRSCIIFGMCILLLGSFICYLAHSIGMLLLGRFIQGCGAASCKLIGAILKDSFGEKELPKAASIMHIAVAIVMPSAPAIGGILQHAFSWHASFLFLLIYAGLNLCLVISLMHETSSHHNRDRLRISFILSTYGQVIRNPVFLSFSLCNLITYGALFSGAATLPIVFQQVIGTSARLYGVLIFLVSASAMVLGSYCNTKLIDHFAHQTILRSGWILGIVAGLAMLIGYYTFGVEGVSILLPLWVFIFGTALVWPYTFAAAFKPFASIAGYASAMFAATQLLGGFALGVLVAYLPEHNQIPLGYILLSTSVVCMVIHQFIARPALQQAAKKVG